MPTSSPRIAAPTTLERLIACRDWKSTAVGVPQAWPQSLRTALSICLKSRFPMILFWGAELIQFYNDAYAPILGKRHPKALGQRAQDCWPEIWDSIGPMLNGVLATGQATWSEDLLLPLERNGFPEELYFTFSYSPIEHAGMVGGVFCAVNETTAKVLREREARERAEALAELDRVKTDFFNNISHEFRTPLTLMLGPLDDRLRSGNIADEALRTDLEMVRRNGRRMLRLVNTLLEFNRIEANRLTLQRTPVDLGALTAGIASTFRSAIEAAGLQLHLDLRLTDCMMVDARLWEHAVLNLLSNALKFTFEGAITVTLERDAGSVRLTVSDSGVGLDEEDRRKVFERFWRAPNQRARTHEGSGIGLALVDEIAHLHGGRAWFSSTRDAGSAVVIEIPILPADDAEAATSAPSPFVADLYLSEAEVWTQSAALRDGAVAAGRLRILAIDDNADLRNYLARILSETYAVTLAADGNSGLIAVRESKPDLILCDVMMPGMDGVAFVRQLRADLRTRHIPVLLLSARAGDEAAAAGIRAGADGYLVKPFSAHGLLARIDRQIMLGRVREEESARFREIADQIPHIVYTHAPDGTVDWANKRWYDLTRLPFDVATTREGWAQVMPPEDFEHLVDTLQHAFSSGEQYEAEVRFKALGDPESAYRWHIVRGLPMLDKGGDIVRWAGTATDVHHRYTAEMDARERLERKLDREHQASLAFQNAALPQALPSVPGLAFSAVYEAAEAEALVGGDWYDAFRLSDGRIVISVGDVAGSGLEASVTMGAVRQAIRGAAQIYPDPASVLDAADRALRSEQPDRIVTAFVGVLDVLTSTLAYASAGHPAPLLRRDDGVIVQLDAKDLPLGMRSEYFRPSGTQAVVTLPARSLLVLYTDGLTEATRDVLEGERTLHDALLTSAVFNADHPASAIRDAVLTSANDDVAILAIRIEGVKDQASRGTPDMRTRWSFPSPDGSASKRVRAEVMEMLRHRGAVQSDVADAELVLGELLGNVVRHTGGDVDVAIDLSGEAPVLHVLDRGPGFTFHARLPRDLMSESGRGLYIAAMLTEDLSVARRADGGSHARAVLNLKKSV